jgi:hypothetical protein
MDFPGFPWIFHNNPKHRILKSFRTIRRVRLWVVCETQGRYAYQHSFKMFKWERCISSHRFPIALKNTLQAGEQTVWIAPKSGQGILPFTSPSTQHFAQQNPAVLILSIVFFSKKSLIHYPGRFNKAFNPACNRPPRDSAFGCSVRSSSSKESFSSGSSP